MRIAIHVSKIRVVAMVCIMCLMKMTYFNVWQVFLVKDSTTTQKMVIYEKEGINDFSFFYSFYGWLPSAYQGV